MSQEKPKIGAGHVHGMARAGLKEISQVLPAFPQSGVQPVEEPGIAFNPTASEVVKGKEYDAALDRWNTESPKPRDVGMER